MSKVLPINKNKVGIIKELDFQGMTGGTGDSGLWSAEVNAFLDNRTLKGLFYSEDWVFIILDLVASEVSNALMVVVEEKKVEGQTRTVPVDNHPLMPMIKQPNVWQDYSSWMYLHVIEYCLMGNAIQWFAEQTQQMIIIPAETVQMNFSDAGVLSEYMVNQDGENFASTGLLNAMSFSPDDILHQRRPNPSNMMWGLSPFIPNRKSILFNRYSQDYLNSFYLKGATPQMVLQMEKNASEDSALRMLRSFETSYTGRRNQRRTLILPKGVKADTVSHSIGDQKLVDIINSNMEKIINILRVPKHALSLAKAGSLGSEEHKMALKFMHTSAINPMKKKIAGSFTKFFKDRGLLKENEHFIFDNSNVEVLKEDEIKRADLAKKQSAIKTLNEVRNDLYDLPPLKGGDVVILGPGQFASSGEPPQTITPSQEEAINPQDDKTLDDLKAEILEEFSEVIKEF
jgi:HK97 family phage portal protein